MYTKTFKVISKITVITPMSGPDVATNATITGMIFLDAIASVHLIMSLSHSASLYQNITKKTFITYMVTFRNLNITFF